MITPYFSIAYLKYSATWDTFQEQRVLAVISNKASDKAISACYIQGLMKLFLRKYHVS